MEAPAASIMDLSVTKKTILIFSRDAGFAKIARAFIQREDIEIIVAEDRQSAQTIIFENIIDLLLVKLEREENETVVLLQSIKDELSRKATKIIVVGTCSDARIRDLFLEFGVDSYFTIPLNKNRLLQTVCSILGLYVRKQPRVPVNLDVYYSTGQGETFFTKCSEISAGGMFIATRNPLERGTTITINFDLSQEETVSCWAKVTWTRGIKTAELMDTTAGMGVRFLNLDDGTFDRIEHLVKSLLLRHAARLEENGEAGKTPEDTLSNDVENQIIVAKVHLLVHFRGSPSENPFGGTSYENLHRLVHLFDEWERNAYIDPGMKPEIASMLRNIIALRLRVELSLHVFWKAGGGGGIASRKLTDFAREVLALTEKALRDIFDFKINYAPDPEDPNNKLLDTAQVSLMRPVLQLRDIYDVYRGPDEPRFFAALSKAEDLLRETPPHDALEPAKYETLSYSEVREIKSKDEVHVNKAWIVWKKIRIPVASVLLFVVLPITAYFSWVPYIKGECWWCSQADNLMIRYRPKRFSGIIYLESAFKKKDTLIATVSDSWMIMSMDEKVAKIRALMDFAKGDGIRELVLRNKAGYIVAQISGSTFLVDKKIVKLATSPPPSTGRITTPAGAKELEEGRPPGKRR